MSDFKIKKAFLFAGGLGTRMRPLTYKTPKPLMKVAGRPLIDWNLDMLAEAGIEEVFINVHHLADQIVSHLKHRTDMQTIVSHEPELLETGGTVLNSLKHLENQPFLTLNSDVIFVYDKENPANLLENEWNEDKMDGLLLLQKLGKTIGYHGNGDFDLGQDKQLMKTKEKAGSYVFTGMQLLHPRIFKNSPTPPFSLNYFYKQTISDDGILSRFNGIVNPGKWLHIGTPEAIDEAEGFLNNAPKDVA